MLPRGLWFNVRALSEGDHQIEMDISVGNIEGGRRREQRPYVSIVRWGGRSFIGRDGRRYADRAMYCLPSLDMLL